MSWTLSTVAVMLAAAAASAVAMLGGRPETHVPAGPFGASFPVHVGHVGRIEVDLGRGGAGGLRRTACASRAEPGTTCYVSN